MSNLLGLIVFSIFSKFLSFLHFYIVFAEVSFFFSARWYVKLVKHTKILFCSINIFCRVVKTVNEHDHIQNNSKLDYVKSSN